MNILEIRDYAWMSQASYLGLKDAVVGDQLSFRLQLLSDTFSESSQFAVDQENEFINDYTLESHRPDTPSGFSATLFSSTDGAEYTIAVRGTDPDNDPLADLLLADGLGVVLSGQAVEQLIDAYRYYRQLTASESSNIYSEAEITKLVQLYAISPAGIFSGPGLEGAILQFESELRQDTGLDKIPEGSTVNFVGHSLGGHVTALLSEMVAQFDGTGIIREALYTKIVAIRDTTGYQAVVSAGNVYIVSFADTSQETLLLTAQQDTAQGIAYRYALAELNSFAILGLSYNNHNQNNELDLYSDTPDSSWQVAA